MGYGDGVVLLVIGSLTDMVITMGIVMCATLFTTFFSGCSKKDITELLPQEEDPEVMAEFGL